MQSSWGIRNSFLMLQQKSRQENDPCLPELFLVLRYSSISVATRSSRQEPPTYIRYFPGSTTFFPAFSK